MLCSIGFFERGSTEGQGVFERQRRKQSKGITHFEPFARFNAVGGGEEEVGAYSVKYGNKSLKDKNYWNEITLIGFFLELKEHFRFLELFNKR